MGDDRSQSTALKGLLADSSAPSASPPEQSSSSSPALPSDAFAGTSLVRPSGIVPAEGHAGKSTPPPSSGRGRFVVPRPSDLAGAPSAAVAHAAIPAAPAVPRFVAEGAASEPSPERAVPAALSPSASDFGSGSERADARGVALLASFSPSGHVVPTTPSDTQNGNAPELTGEELASEIGQAPPAEADDWAARLVPALADSGSSPRGVSGPPPPPSKRSRGSIPGAAAQRSVPPARGKSSLPPPPPAGSRPAPPPSAAELPSGFSAAVDVEISVETGHSDPAAASAPMASPSAASATSSPVTSSPAVEPLPADPVVTSLPAWPGTKRPPSPPRKETVPPAPAVVAALPVPAAEPSSPRAATTSFPDLNSLFEVDDDPESVHGGAHVATVGASLALTSAPSQPTSDADDEEQTAVVKLEGEDRTRGDATQAAWKGSARAPAARTSLPAPPPMSVPSVRPPAASPPPGPPVAGARVGGEASDRASTLPESPAGSGLSAPAVGRSSMSMPAPSATPSALSLSAPPTALTGMGAGSSSMGLVPPPAALAPLPSVPPSAFGSATLGIGATLSPLPPPPPSYNHGGSVSPPVPPPGSLLPPPGGSTLLSSAVPSHMSSHIPSAMAAVSVVPTPNARPLPTGLPPEGLLNNRAFMRVVAPVVALLAVIGLWLMLRGPSTGQLVVTVSGPNSEQVGGVQVFIDGQLLCERSPCAVSELVVGTHLVRAAAEGYATTADQAVIVQSGQAIAQNFALAAAIKPALLRVTAVGEGLRVTIDGKDVGNAPAELSGIAPGEHVVRIEAPGRETIEKRIAIAAGETRTVELEPKVTRGRLTVKLGEGAQGAKVMLDGKELSKLPAELDLDAQREHVLTAKGRAGEFRQVVRFDEGKATQTVEVQLADDSAEATEPAPAAKQSGGSRAAAPAKPKKAAGATLNISSTPPSTVVLDGRPLGRTPRSGVSVTPGSHTVTFVNPQRGRKTVKVQVSAGGNKNVSVRF